MNILVCLKQTFDTEERIVIKDGVIQEEGVEFVINPYDEYAVEEAIQLKEKHGGEVTVLTLGPERAQQSIRTAMAMGADKGIFIDCEEYESELDEYTISQLLFSAIQSEDIEFDIILCGYMAIDDGSAQVGPRLSELLDIPHVSTIVKCTIEDSLVHLEKDVEGDTEYIEATLPILVTAQQGLNEPRYPSLQGIMKAKRKPLTTIDIDDLDVDNFTAKTHVTETFLPPQKEAGRVLSGEATDQVKELIELLHKEAKVI